MSVFTVSTGEAASFQEHYQRLIEAWLREILNHRENQPQHSEQENSEIRVTDSERVVYGQVGKEFRNELTPELIEQLEELRATPVGGVVNSIGSKTIELDGQVVLQSDQSGRVIVNSVLEVEQSSFVAPTPSKNQRDVDKFLQELENSKIEVGEAKSLQYLKESEEIAKSLQDLEDSKTEVDVGTRSLQKVENEQLIQKEQLPKKLTSQNGVWSKSVQEDKTQTGGHEDARILKKTSPHQPQPTYNDTLLDAPNAPMSEQYEGGLAKARSSVEEIPDNSLKQMLFSQLNEMRSELQRQQQQKQILEDLVTQRLTQPQSAFWWQQLKGAVTQTWQSLKELSQEHSAAATLKTLFHNQVPPGGQVYQADNYTLQREGRSYTLMDKSGMRLMQFQSSPMGVQVDRESGKLQANHYRDIKQLSAMQSRGEELSGAFAPAGASETAYLARVNAITKALGQYAQATGSNVQVDGKFAYKWLATPDGRVRIDAKDGRGLLLVQAQGQLRCRMSDRDLAHFEQMLPVLKSSRNRSKTVDLERN